MSRFRELLPLYAVIALGFLGFALTITLYIPMLMDRHFDLLPLSSSTSLRASVSGLLLAMYPLGQFFGSPIIGNLSDYYGRKNVLLLSLLACVLGFIGIALSIEFRSLVFIFIFSFLTGVCESNMAISQSVIADKFQDPVLKNKFIGYAYSACSFGYMLGPLLGGLLGVRLGYASAFWFTAIAVLVLIAWIFIYFRDDYVPNKTVEIKWLEAITSIKSIFARPKLFKFYAINFLIFFAVQGLNRVVPLYVVNEWKPSLHVYALLISWVSFMCFISNLFILGKLADRFTSQKLLSALLLVSGACIMLVVLPSSLLWMAALWSVSLIVAIMTLPTCTSWLSHHAEASEQGQVLGNNQALLVLGESSSAAIGGLIAAILIPLPIVVMGVILLITGLFVLKAK